MLKHLKKFADDTHMLYADRNLKLLETAVNAELSNVYDWLIADKLTGFETNGCPVARGV